MVTLIHPTPCRAKQSISFHILPVGGTATLEVVGPTILLSVELLDEQD